jgi:hypothetical protein
MGGPRRRASSGPTSGRIIHSFAYFVLVRVIEGLPEVGADFDRSIPVSARPAALLVSTQASSPSLFDSTVRRSDWRLPKPRLVLPPEGRPGTCRPCRPTQCWFRGAPQGDVRDGHGRVARDRALGRKVPSLERDEGNDERRDRDRRQDDDVARGDPLAEGVVVDVVVER